MKKKTLSQVKNLMRRAIADLLDPVPGIAAQQTLRDHFEHRCAYCGGDAVPRDGHIDHAERGKGNALGNLILACKICNGDEKREMGWEEFLRLKCVDDKPLEMRRARIRAWQEQHPSVARTDSESVAAARAEAERAISEFELAYNRLRAAMAPQAR